MGKHSKKNRALTYVAAVGGAVGMAAVLTGSAHAGPDVPYTCLVAPGGPECERYEARGLLDLDLDVDTAVCADAVVVHRDGRAAVADVSVPCPPRRVTPVTPVTPVPVVPVVPDDDDADEVDEAPVPVIVDGAATDVPIVNG